MLLKGFELFQGVKLELSTDEGSSVSADTMHGLFSVNFELKPKDLHIDLSFLGCRYVFFRLKSDVLNMDEAIQYINPTTIGRRILTGIEKQLEGLEGVNLRTLFFLERTDIHSSWCSTSGIIDTYRVKKFNY